MKKVLFSLGILLIGFIGFSNAQFISSVPGLDCYNKTCSFDGFSNISILNNSRGASEISVNCLRSSRTCYFSYYSPINISTLNSCCQKAEGSSSYVRLSDGFKISSVYNGLDISNVSVVYSSSKMPVSELTPVITGLNNSINEFIPYISYIGIGLLIVVIGFVAIKRLINWVRAKIFSSFKR